MKESDVGRTLSLFRQAMPGGLMSNSYGGHAHVLRPPLRLGHACLAVHLLQGASPAIVKSFATVLAVDAM